MPLYEYECTQCHRHTEKIQKFSDPEITTCPHCGGPLQRVISAPAFALKGGGWYADGYGSAKPKPAEGAASASSDSGVAAGAEGKAAAGSASAPAAAAETKPASSAPAATAPAASKE